MTNRRTFVSIITLAAALAFATTAVGQRYTLSGTVVDVSGSGLAGIHVFAAGTTLGTITDPDGGYSMRVRSGRHVMVASAVGYTAARDTIDVAGDRELHFVLHEAILNSAEVVVTAARRPQLAREVPASLEVVPASLLDSRNVQGIDGALQTVSGVQVQGNQIIVRGTSGFAYNTGSRVLMLVDGMPMLSPDTDGLPLDGLPPTQIRQIEVLKGPGSALYGSGALGGVINVITKDVSEERRIAFRTYAGAYQPTVHKIWSDRWKPASSWRPFGGVAGVVSGSTGSRTSGWLSVDFREDQGFRRLSSLRQLQSFGKLAVRGEGRDFSLLAGFLARKRNTYLFWNGLDDALNPGTVQLSANAPPSGTNDTVVNQLTLLPSLRLTPGRSIWAFRGRLFGTAIRPIDDNGRMKSLSDGTFGARFGGEAQWQRIVGNGHQLIAGAALDANATRSSFYENDSGGQAGRQPELGLYGQWESRMTPHLSTVAGFRFDWFRISSSETASRLSPKLSIGYDLGEGITARLSGGLGFRVPSLAERYTDDQSFFPIFRNPFLVPETSASAELGLRGLASGGRMSVDWDVAGFVHRLDNLIEPRFVRASTAGGDRLGFQFVNLSGGRVAGIEATVVVLDASGHRMRAGYTFLHSRDADTGLALPFRPTHLFVAGADVEVPGLNVGVDYRFASRPSVVDTDFARFVPDADVIVRTSVLDLSVGYSIGPVWARLIVKNAANYHYLERPALLAAPRRLVLQVSAIL